MVVNLFLTFSGLLGLAIGSLLNVLVSRFNPEKPHEIYRLLRGRSFCPFCKEKLKWFELIPLLSFIFLKGRCRYCGKRISWRYPLVELLTALIFLGVSWRFLKFPFFTFYLYSSNFLISFLISLLIFIFLIYSSILLALALLDLYYYLLPDKIVFPAIGFAILVDLFLARLARFSPQNFYPQCGLNFLGPFIDYFNCKIPHLLSYFLGALLIAGFFFLLYFLSRGRALGFGDVKFGVFLGLMLGLTNGLFALIISFIIGALVALVLLVLKKKKIGDQVPFAPLLVLGVLITIFWGEFLVNSYFSLFNKIF